ncbi:hypothetical protein PMO01_04410 [Pseudomonas moraviensis R28-S]|uniref:Uncharacterized protein n=1 Tax=Pseudomonas moraviensis R28-S TaxID=1395516 RepID=V8RCD6_9PSED|nr:hypothetical protein PMO01_04410 [Pseudomonas moraviensis R28-S]
MRGGTLLAFIQEKPGSIAVGTATSHKLQAASFKRSTADLLWLWLWLWLAA